MAIVFRFFVERASEVNAAGSALTKDAEATDGAYSVETSHLSGRRADDISDEVGFQATGSIAMRILNSRSAEATDAIIRGALGTATQMSGASALYLELDSAIFRRTVAGVLECYLGSGYWSAKRLMWLEALQPTFVVTDKDFPPEQFRAWQTTEGSKTSYVIERLDGTEVIEVHSLSVSDRTLIVEYERRNTVMLDQVANLLILVKILRELLQDSHRGKVDTITFHSQSGGPPASLPYV